MYATQALHNLAAALESQTAAATPSQRLQVPHRVHMSVVRRAHDAWA